MKIPETKSVTVSEMWASYQREVLHPDAPPDQLRECRMAFYGGAVAMLGGMIAAVGGDNVDDEVGIAWLAARQQELQDFGANIEAIR